ncbi:MAG: hypothetical protein WA081_05730 [Desulfosalsimonadaceae bacterium]
MTIIHRVLRSGQWVVQPDAGVPGNVRPVMHGRGGMESAGRQEAWVVIIIVSLIRSFIPVKAELRRKNILWFYKKEVD